MEFAMQASTGHNEWRKVEDPWGKTLDTPEGAFDAFLRYLDSVGCVPGWLALQRAHSDFYNDSSCTLNGVTLNMVHTFKTGA